ncbi:MAG TPA: hypothetical protein VFC86_07195 [Planctomycetota bacterium]|nr:hypothetical protein [Planctomycetota bacterium]
MYRTPPLGIKVLEVYRALFRSQLPDTLKAVRDNLQDWRAVHVVLSETMTTRKDISSSEMREMLTKGIRPDGAPLEPGIAMENDRVPGGTLVTLVPDALKPKNATEYGGWTYLPYLELRRRLAAFVERALPAPPAPASSLAQLLFASPKGTPVYSGSGSQTSAPDFARAVAGLVNREAGVTFFDSLFGHEAPAAAFLEQAERLFNMPGRRSDMLFFQDSWYAVFHRRGELKVAKISP